MTLDRRAVLGATFSAAVAAPALALALAQAPAQTAATGGPPLPNPSRTGLFFRPNHVSLRVTDLARAVDWWSRVFGAQVVRRSRIGNIDPDAAIASLHIADGFHIELVGGGRARAATPPPASIGEDYGVLGWKHVGFTVRDMDEVKAHLTREGVKVDYEVERPDYGVRIALLREPDGYFIELYAPLA
ncbi:MAG TPA: VOC family protein [Microvirga sp.]|jgi:catechol 2,3-dioxygenase-like lactoylglutathione lyase family enzyme|nr:VOC family protein [Microvirga sp.]